MSKLCPKCKAEWPDNVKYCVCGEKLSTAIDDFLEIMNIDKDVKEDLKNKYGR